MDKAYSFRIEINKRKKNLVADNKYKLTCIIRKMRCHSVGKRTSNLCRYPVHSLLTRVDPEEFRAPHNVSSYNLKFIFLLSNNLKILEVASMVSEAYNYCHIAKRDDNAKTV